MGFGNGVAPAPEVKHETNGSVTVKLHPLVITIVLSLFTFCAGLFADYVRSDATLSTKVAATSEDTKQMVTKDQFVQYQNDTKEHLDRIEEELKEIKTSIDKRH